MKRVIADLHCDACDFWYDPLKRAFWAFQIRYVRLPESVYFGLLDMEAAA